MVAQRRLSWNFGLDRALAHADSLGKPLLVFEPLRAGYRWASDRHHRFVIDGMAEHVGVLQAARVAYYPYVEPSPGAGKGLLEALSRSACLIVTDRYPAFFLPSMQEAAARAVSVLLEGVDSCGLLPIAAADRTFSAAFHFRRFLQKTLPEHLLDAPDPDPFSRERALPPATVSATVLRRWPSASGDLLGGGPSVLSDLPIDHSVGPVAACGGSAAGRARLRRFIDTGLARYGTDRNHPDRDGQSGLSPWLHWGHVSVHEIFHAVAARSGWSPARLSPRSDGKREGWWGLDPDAEKFLDELVTWREIGFNFCALRPNYAEYDSLPEWARATLEEHAGDPRPALYSLEQFESAATHDELWNAAQRQLVAEGVIHNYLRMLWGKKILEWTPHPRQALDIMVELNNKYAIDGRDPNSYTGIFWVLGRFDRGWPERALYGKVRSMTSASTRRKIDVNGYLGRWGGQESLGV